MGSAGHASFLDQVIRARVYFVKLGLCLHVHCNKKEKKKKRWMRRKGREQRRVHKVIRVCQQRSQNSQFSGLVDPQRLWSPQLVRLQVPLGLCTAPSTL